MTVEGDVFCREFCQRVILCNSLVWSCSLTGKPQLTYQEALQSEENARMLLKTFPKKVTCISRQCQIAVMILTFVYSCRDGRVLHIVILQGLVLQLMCDGKTNLYG